MAERPEPIADRMRWLGYEPPGERLLRWGWAVERLTSSRRYWLATTRPDGVPHVMPVWGVWLEEAVVFSTGRRTRKARNIHLDPRCVVTTEHADEAVVIEGVAREQTDQAELRRADEAYRSKYGSSIFIGDSPVFAVRPTIVFGVVDGVTGAWPTRWRFGARADPSDSGATGEG